MAFDSTTTENDLDAGSRTFAQEMRAAQPSFEPDLAVDGLSDSVLSRFLRLFGIGRR